jgi:hypothetical protein
MRRPLFLCPEEAPGGAGDGLQHIAAKLRTLGKNFVIFLYCKDGGGGGVQFEKMRPPQKERKKHKKV